MFFKSKKEIAQKAETAPVIEKKELLYRENIRTGCAPATKQEAILAAGKMLVETGYVEPEYAEAMLEREKTCSTFMGNGLALPHGVEAAKKRVLQSGISVQTFKEPIDWDGNPVRIVIGIAGVGDAHLDILAQIAEAMLDEGSCDQRPSAWKIPCEGNKSTVRICLKSRQSGSILYL